MGNFALKLRSRLMPACSQFNIKLLRVKMQAAAEFVRSTEIIHGQVEIPLKFTARNVMKG